MSTEEPLIPLARPDLGDAEIRAAGRVFRSARLLLGPENQRFEAGLAELSGRAHAICVTSGTSALELALWVLDMERGGSADVVVPAGGFPAAANAVLRTGGRPVPVDLAPETWTMDVEAAADALTDATRAMISIDMFGLVAEAGPLQRLAEQAGIVLIDDAACSLGGCDSAGVPGGGYGALATFSFHPRKVITTGEGGAVVCDDADLAAGLRELRNHGQSFAATGGRRFARVGTNARLAEVAAAIGCVQLDQLDRMQRERALLCDGYRERLAGLRDAGKLSWQHVPQGARSANQTFAVLLGPGIDRSRVQANLAACNIETGVAAFAMNRIDSYADLSWIRGRSYPIAEALHDRGLALPLFPGMRSAELDRVCGALVEAVA
ncbi:MAG: DegT/DnrJ/EryC1/StrS family aminotransferase [Proteobacteria bacterium]|nr:DegT/DnrJ/EryC1/StrS family aminotransferase [Pseudomonadota bacterium]